MKKIYTGILLASLFLSSGFGQQIVQIQGRGVIMFLPFFKEDAQLDILGTPFMSESWMYGSFHAYDTIRIEGLFRYNIYNQEIQFIHGTDTLSIAAPLNVDSINFSGKNFTYSLYLEEKKGTDALGSAYFEILNEGDLMLLKKNYVEIRERSYAKNYMGGGGDGREFYYHNSSYYYKPAPGAAAIKMKKNRKFILGIFGEKKEEVLSYIKENQLSLKNEEDLEKIFSYYNRLDI